MVLSWGSRYILSSCGSDLLCVSSFIFWVVVCGRCVCDLVEACGIWREREICENSLVIIFGLCGSLVLTCCLVLLGV